MPSLSPSHLLPGQHVGHGPAPLQRAAGLDEAQRRVEAHDALEALRQGEAESAAGAAHIQGVVARGGVLETNLLKIHGGCENETIYIYLFIYLILFIYAHMHSMGITLLRITYLIE